MSGIYIPGMAMPAEQMYVLIIAIQSDGRVFPVHIDVEGNPMIFQNEEMQNRAIPVPEHGDLIDRDELRKKKWTITWDDGKAEYYNAEDIEAAPAVIPAEGRTE